MVMERTLRRATTCTAAGLTPVKCPCCKVKHALKRSELQQLSGFTSFPTISKLNHKHTFILTATEMDWHLCSSFLVLLTAQSTLEYSPKIHATFYSVHCFIYHTSMSNLESPSTLKYTSLDCVRKVAKENLPKLGKNKPHIESPRQAGRFKPTTSLL